jgi:hypothetical protein
MKAIASKHQKLILRLDTYEHKMAEMEEQARYVPFGWRYLVMLLVIIFVVHLAVRFNLSRQGWHTQRCRQIPCAGILSRENEWRRRRRHRG